jgi:pimeloyl-ACP methyl ester carboxylesterase
MLGWFAIAALSRIAIANAQATPTVLVPGLDETTGNVTWWYNALANSGKYFPYFVDGLNSSSAVSTQTTVVTSFLSSHSLSSNAVIVGHSQGGLVARYASRSTSLLGLLTVASPNAGAPIASSYAQTYAISLESLAGFELFEINQGLGLAWDVCPFCADRWYNVTTYLNDFAAIVGTGFEVVKGVPFLNSNPHLGDLAPGSGVISSLQTNPGLELAADREAIAVDVVDYAAAPFRLTAGTEADADALAQLVAIWATELNFDGDQIYFEATNGDCYDADMCPRIANVGNAMVTYAELVANLPLDVNYYLIGGVPNDGLVPTANEALPGKAPIRTQLHITHNQVLWDNNGTDILGAMDFITGR